MLQYDYFNVFLFPLEWVWELKMIVSKLSNRNQFDLGFFLLVTINKQLYV